MGDGTTYFVRAVSYAHKMFMKLYVAYQVAPLVTSLIFFYKIGQSDS